VITIVKLDVLNWTAGGFMSKVQSIEELKQKCAEKNMPLEKMRFFIGENRKEPKCFGVYLDESTGNWVVYKNKADGTRAVRYEGPDEARAAQEIWTKIGDEVKHRKDMHASPYDESVLREIYEQSEQKPSAWGGVFRAENGKVPGNKLEGASDEELRRMQDKELSGVPRREPEGLPGRETEGATGSGLKGLPGGESEGAIGNGLKGAPGKEPGESSGRVQRSVPGKASGSAARRASRRASRRGSGGILGGILGIFGDTFSFIWNEFVLEHPFASLFFALVGTSLFLEFVFPSPQKGYYQVEDTVYYYLEDQWYMYDDSGEWVTSYVDLDDPEDYYLGDFYSEEYGTEAFEGTEYYGHYLEEKREKEKERENRDNDDYDNDCDDDDYDYDYDDWDADDTDWDTDW
jgi:hypothetical protein